MNRLFQSTIQEHKKLSYKSFSIGAILHPFDAKCWSSLTRNYTIKFIPKSVSELILHRWLLWPESCLPALLLISCQIRCHLSSYKGHKANKNFVSHALANSAEMQPCHVCTTRVSSTMQIWYISRWTCNSHSKALLPQYLLPPLCQKLQTPQLCHKHRSWAHSLVHFRQKSTLSV